MDKEDEAHIYNGILLSHKKNEIMPFAAISTHLEIIILSEVRERQVYDIAYMWNQKNDINELIYKTNNITDLVKEPLMVTMGGKRERNWEFGIDTYTLLYLK